MALPDDIQAADAALLDTDRAERGIAGESSYEELWLEAEILGQQSRYTVLVLRRTDDRILVRGEDLQRLRLRLPAVTSLNYLGESYYLLDELPGLRYQVGEASQTLALEADPELYELTEIRGAADGIRAPTPAPPGGFFNYDIQTTHAHGKTNSSGLFELGLFGGRGVATSTFLANDHDRSTNVVRLDTTWTRDIPGLRASLRLGDGISGPGSWGRSVRFGGVQWATNFATQPGFITFPLPDMSGEAALPSSMDLYVNGMLRMRDEVPSGPFSINNLPVMTGQGEVQLVLRDMLGREQVITRAFYTSPLLLKKGLHDYSYELGTIRDNYSIASNDYGRNMAVATHRLGLSDRFTGEFRVELLSGQQTVGLGGAFLWDDKAVFHASVAASHNDLGSGCLLALGFNRQTPGISFGADTQLTSGNFTQLGLQAGQPAPKRMSRAFISVPLKKYGSVNVNYAYQDSRVREKLETLGASYNVSLGRLGYLGVSAVRFLGKDAYTLIGLTLTRALGRRTTASANGSFQRANKQLLLQVQRNLPVGSGFGYRLRAGALDSDRLEAGLSAQNNFGTYHFDAVRDFGQTSYRANISGGIAFVGSGLHFSRRITDSFAVVKVGDFANVRVYADNHIVARTHSNGSALLPRLRAYQENPVRIELGDLPLDARIDEQQLQAVPYFRSGLLLEFPIRRARGALLTIVLDNGEPLPVGVRVMRLADGMLFPTGLNGEVYLTGMAASNRLRVTLHGQYCEFDVDYPETTDPLPELGTFICAGVNP